MQKNRCSIDKSAAIIIGYIALIIFNISTVGSIINIFLTIPQYCIIIYFLLKKQYDKSILYHFIFIVTSITPTTALIETTVYNYASLKLYGPFGYSYIVSIILFFATIRRKHLFSPELQTVYKLLLFLALCGVLFGLTGVIFSDYYFEYFIAHSVYIVILLINLLILINNNSIHLIRKIYSNTLFLLIASPIATFIAFNLGIFTMYGTDFKAVIQAEVDFYSIALLVGIYYIKEKKWVIVSILCLFYNLMISGGGREIMIAFAGIVLFLMLTFNKSVSLTFKKATRMVKAILLLIVLLILNLGFVSDDSLLFYHKFKDVASLVNILTLDDIQNLSKYVTQSPYVRIASLIDTLHDSSSNIIHFLFGNGYGGYFTDSLGLLADLDHLEDGGWPYKYVAAGKFPYAHDSVACIPLLNGVVGLICVLVVSFKILKNIRRNYMSFAVIPWLLTSFYFSTTYGVVALLMLIASQIDLTKQNEQYENSFY